MNLDYLTYFIEVIICRSIGKAAKKLNRNPATLTNAISQLEEDVGEKLLLRTPYGILPTEQGKALYNDALQIVQLQEHWKLQGAISSNVTDVFIGTTPTLYNYIMPEISYRALTNATGLPINLVVSQFTDLGDFAENLQQRRFNMVLLEGQPQSIFEFNLSIRNLDLQMIHMGQYNNFVFFNQAHPLAHKNTISIEEFIQYKRCSTKEDLPAHMVAGLYSSFEDVLLYYSQNDLLYLLAHNNEYIAVLSEFAALSPCAQCGLIRAIPFSDMNIATNLYLFCSADEFLTPEELIITDIIKQYFMEYQKPRLPLYK